MTPEPNQTRAFYTSGLHFRDDGDGRTVEGRIVPYNEIATVVEVDDTGKVIKYDEMFLPHSCARMAQGALARNNAHWIKLLLDHDEGFDRWIGGGVMLWEEDDGAYASFRLHRDQNLDKVRSILEDTHSGLSIHFADIKPPREVDGVRQRVQVHIDHVAATPTPAYVGAGITAMRETGEPLIGTPHLDSVRQFLASVKGGER